MEKYTHFKQGFNSAGIIIPVSKILENIKLPNSDYYANLFTYDKDVIDYFVSNDNSIKGYKGNAYTNKLVFDFDSEKLEYALKDVVLLVNFLIEKQVDLKSIAVYFSGNKGFHVEVLTSENYNPDELKSICRSIALKSNIKTLDLRIYSTIRAFRLPNTKHQVSGLYKTYISFEELEKYQDNVEAIKEKAKTKSTFLPNLEPTTVSFKQYLEKEELPRSKNSVIVADSSEIRGLSRVNFGLCPSNVPRCIYALLNGIMVPRAMNPEYGGRSEAFFKLARFYRNQGWDKNIVINVLLGASKKNAELYPEFEPITKEEIVNQHVASVFSDKSVKEQKAGSPGTKSDDDQLLKYCNSIQCDKECTLHKKKTNVSTIVKINQISANYSEYAKNLKTNLVRTGIDFIDREMQLELGTTTLLIGATGSGKTSVALDMMAKSNEIGQNSIFFSMDMHKNLVFQKIATKVTGWTVWDVRKAYESGDQQKISFIEDSIEQIFGKTFFEFTSVLSLDEMKERIDTINEKLKSDGESPIKFVVVDYAGRIAGPYSDKHANASYNAIKSTSVAAETNAAWLFLCQISRNIGDGCSPLRTKRAAKESGDWEESASGVITMWRPFMGNVEHDNYVRMFIAKNRMGQEIESILNWHGPTGTVKDMNSVEYENYKQNMRSLEIEYLKSKVIPG